MSMTQREREQARLRREFIAEDERQERELRDRPLREAEETFQQTARELATLRRQRLLTGRDEDFQADAEIATLSLPIDEACRVVETEADKFIRLNPDYYGTENNHRQIMEYLDRQGITIPNANAIKTAWLRLSEYGLLDEPVVNPEPLAPDPEPEVIPSAEYTSEPQQHPQHGQRLYDGWNPQTGEPCQYTEWDVSKMTADQFRLAMRIPTIVKVNEPSR